MAVGFISIILLSVSVNYIIDPYAIWKSKIFQGFNDIKSERLNRFFQFKAADLIHTSPKSLMIGTSSVAFMSPKSKSLNSEKYQPVYNSALVGGHLKPIRNYLEHAIYNSPNIENIFWGIDFLSFNKNLTIRDDFSDTRLNTSIKSFSDIANSLLTWSSLTDTFNTIKSSRNKSKYIPYTSAGQLTAIDMEQRVARDGMQKRFEKSLSLYVHNDEYFRKYENSLQAWIELEKILDIVKRNNINLYLFVTPVHISMIEGIKQRGLWGDYKLWLEKLSGYSPYWDFSRPNKLNTEAINDHIKNYWDVSHYRESVGNLVFNRMLNASSNDLDDKFGTYITPNMVNQYLQSLDEEMTKMEQTNNGIRKFVETVINNPT